MTLNLMLLFLSKSILQISAWVENTGDDATDLLEYLSLKLERHCSYASKEDCILNWICATVGLLCLVYTSFIFSLTVTLLDMGKLYSQDISDKALCRIAVILCACCFIESALLHHDKSQLYFIPCNCEDTYYQQAFCQLGISMIIVMSISMLGCFTWSTSLCNGIVFIFFMTVSQIISNLLSLFFITSSRNTLCNSSMQRLTRTFVMYSGNLLGILLVHIFRNNMQDGLVDPVKPHKDSFSEEKHLRMIADQSKRGQMKVNEDHSLEEKSRVHSKEKAGHSLPKYRWSRRKHPLSSRFGTDAFLPCVVLMKKKGRSSPPVAVNVVNIGLSSTKHHPPRHTHRRASLGVIKERAAGEEATWARLSQRRRTSLPTTFHSSRKQNVMSSVLVETSVIAELHTTLNELSVATGSSNIEVDECTSRMRKLLKPYETENLCPSQVVWLHDSVSSNSDNSDDEDVGRGTRSNLNKRVNSRRHDWSNSDSSVWTTTTSATGLPSLDPGPVKSKRLPKIQKTPSNTPHDSRCSSPISGKDGVGSLSRRRTIHNIGPLNSPGRPQTFFSQDDVNSNKDVKEGRRSKSFSLFTSSDYESCDNLLTDCSEGETVKQMPDLQQPSAARRGSHEGLPHDNEQSPKIRMLITEPTIDEGSEEEEKFGGNENSCSLDSSQSTKSSGSELSVQEEGYSEQIFPSDELAYIFEGDEYKAELLEKVYSWNFPIFELADETHCVLSQMGYKLFDDTGLFETFKIPRKPFIDYMRALENGYRNIPYHNRIHAADVLHGCWFMTTQQIPGFCETSPLFSSDSSDSDSGTAHTQVNTVGNGSLAQAIPALELMALYLAAAMHDYDHPGRTNAFLVETRHPLAMLYNDRSVLENHHASASWELLHSKPIYDFLVNLDVAEWKRLRFLIVEAILATDLKKHFELMSRFSAKISRRTDTSSEATEPTRQEGCIKWTADEDRLLVCQMVIKLADIGGPTKVRDLHVTWTKAICQEFFTQGDEERQLNSPVSPFMDREQPQVAQLQRTFIKNLIAPLVCKMHRAGILAGYAEDSDVPERPEEENILEPTEENSTVNCRSLIREQLADNLRYWHAILQQEMSGHDEMNLVFKNCHNVTLKHENINDIDVYFAKNLTENRRDKLQNHSSKTATTTSAIESKERHNNETKIPSFLRNYSSRPPKTVATDSNSSNTLCNKTPDKSWSKLPNVYKKIP